ncbi:glycosyltransferase [Cetobacterium sp.]|uniref:glycosyltransferase n=1 Tax=Cetobacterium sp. TaxID=2071632 RepID=UPI003F2EB6A0
MKKIVHVISSCSPGGAEILVKDTLIELKKTFDNVELWVMSKVKDCFSEDIDSKIFFEKNYVNELEKKGIKVYFFEKKPKKYSLNFFLNILKRFLKIEPNIIHCHLEEVTFHIVLILGIFKFVKNIKIYQTIHNVKIDYPKLQKYFIRRVITKFVSISDEVTISIKNIGIPNIKIVQIENAINLEKFKIENRYINKKPKHLIAVGRMVQQKNYSLMIKAFSKAISNLENKPILKIIGTGLDEQFIKKIIIEEKIQKNIALLGNKINISEYLKEADIYLMSSKWEGLSISLIEACSAGLPIICTNVGSNNNVVKDGINGFLIESENEKLFSEKLQELMENQELRIKFSKNSVNISKDFSLEEKVKKLIKLYGANKNLR